MAQRLDRAALGRTDVFRGLDDAALDEALKAARERRVSRGSVLFDQGEEARAGFLLVEGRVKISQVSPEGHQVVVHYIGPGEMFAFAAVFAGIGYPGAGIAVTDSVALAWEMPGLTALMERHPKVAMNALEIVGKRFQALQERYRELATEKVERRIARAVLRLATQAGKRVPEGVLIDFPISRQDIAEITGATLHTVSRTLSAWEAQGLIQGGRQRVLIRDKHRLVSLAEDL